MPSNAFMRICLAYSARTAFRKASYPPTSQPTHDLTLLSLHISMYTNQVDRTFEHMKDRHTIEPLLVLSNTVLQVSPSRLHPFFVICLLTIPFFQTSSFSSA